MKRTCIASRGLRAAARWFARVSGAEREIAGRVILSDMGLVTCRIAEADVRILAHQGNRYGGYYVLVDGQATCMRIMEPK